MNETPLPSSDTEQAPLDVGEEMLGWARDLFPLCRSITGDGLRETLRYLKQLLPKLEIHDVPTGTRVFDWEIPEEWRIREAWLEHEDGTRIVDFSDSNLHLVNYSTAVDTWLPLEEMDEHLHSLPDQPDLIPYVTSYYERRWGFCLPHQQRRALCKGKYHAYIDAEHFSGSLSYADLVIPGDSAEEIFFSTYVCHPSMANNELSGPVVATALARHVAALPRRRYTYRFVWAPETIGAISYLAANLDHLKAHVIAAFNLSCVDDDRSYSYVASPWGDTLADRVALHVLNHTVAQYEHYDYLMRGSDERQYCSPGVDLPMVALMRSKYGTYPEYHTSGDDLGSVVTPTGLAGGFEVNRKCTELLENNHVYRTLLPCEPQLGKRGLYANLSVKVRPPETKSMLNILAFANGSRDLINLADRIGRSAFDCLPVIDRLLEAGVLARVEECTHQ